MIQEVIIQEKEPITYIFVSAFTLKYIENSIQSPHNKKHLKRIHYDQIVSANILWQSPHSSIGEALPLS